MPLWAKVLIWNWNHWSLRYKVYDLVGYLHYMASIAQLAMQANWASFSCTYWLRDCISSVAYNSFSCSCFVSASISACNPSFLCCSSKVALSIWGFSRCCYSPRMEGMSSLWIPCRCSFCFSSSFSSCSSGLWMLSTCFTMANSFLDSLSYSSRGPMSATPLDLAILIQVWVLILSSSSAKNSGIANLWGIIFPASNRL